MKDGFGIVARSFFFICDEAFCINHYLFGTIESIINNKIKPKKGTMTYVIKFIRVIRSKPAKLGLIIAIIDNMMTANSGKTINKIVYNSAIIPSDSVDFLSAIFFSSSWTLPVAIKYSFRFPPDWTVI